MNILENSCKRFEFFSEIFRYDLIPVELKDKILTYILQNVLQVTQITELLLCSEIKQNCKNYILSKIDLSVNVSLAIPEKLTRNISMTNYLELSSMSFVNYPNQCLPYMYLDLLLSYLEYQGLQINTLTSSQGGKTLRSNSRKDDHFILRRLLKLAKYHKSIFNYIPSVDFLTLDYSFDSISVDVSYHLVDQPFPFERYRKLQKITLRTCDLLSRDTNSLLIGISGGLKSGIPLTSLIMKYDRIYNVFRSSSLRFFLTIIEELVSPVEVSIERQGEVSMVNYDEPSLILNLLNPIKHLFKSTYLHPSVDLVGCLHPNSSSLDICPGSFLSLDKEGLIPHLISNSLKSLTFHALQKSHEFPITLNLRGIPQLKKLKFISWNIDSKTFDNLLPTVKKIELVKCTIEGIFHLPRQLQNLELVNTFPTIDSFIRSHCSPGIKLIIENQTKYRSKKSKFNKNKNCMIPLYTFQANMFLSVIENITSTTGQLIIRSRKDYYFIITTTHTIENSTSYVIQQIYNATHQIFKEIELSVNEYGCCVKETLLYYLFDFFMKELEPTINVSEDFESRLVQYLDGPSIQKLDIDYSLKYLNDFLIEENRDVLRCNKYCDGKFSGLCRRVKGLWE